MDLIRTLNSIGKSAFVKYYYCFKDRSPDECIAQFDENYTDKAKRTRTSKAKRIFREFKNLEALEIIANSDRVDDSTRNKAKQILFHETR